MRRSSDRDRYSIPGCVIRRAVQLGERCIVHSNAVVGSDGFGFAKKEDGSWYKIHQAEWCVVIGDEVEIGACTTIDRATIGETRIGKGTKLDNLVQIGHGSLIGQHNLICAQAGLAGSTEIRDRVILAGQVGVAGHLTIGDDVVATAQTGIGKDIEPGRIVSGSPSFDHRTWLKWSILQERIPDIAKLVKNLEIRLNDLENTLNEISELK